MNTQTNTIRLTPLARLMLLTGIAASGYLAVERLAPELVQRLIPAARSTPSLVPPRADLPPMGDVSTTQRSPSFVVNTRSMT